MILDWMDEQETPHLSLTDRFMMTLYDLAISDKEQMERITGWTKAQIEGAIKRLRRLGNTPEEKDGWIKVWKTHPRKPAVFTLGTKGISHVLALRQEFANERQRPLKGQIAHFMGINEVLASIMEAEIPLEYWYSSKESASWIYHQLQLGQKKEKERSLPIRPDAMVSSDGCEFFVEFDVGTESIPRIEAKFVKYRQLAEILGERMKTILFVCLTENRVERVKKALKDSRIVWQQNTKVESDHFLGAIVGTDASKMLRSGVMWVKKNEGRG